MTTPVPACSASPRSPPPPIPPTASASPSFGTPGGRGTILVRCTGVRCSPAVPPAPARRVGTSCSVTTQVACTGSYQGNASTCGATGNPTTCCPANFNDVGGVTVQDIFDFLNAYFGSAGRRLQRRRWRDCPGHLRLPRGLLRRLPRLSRSRLDPISNHCQGTREAGCPCSASGFPPPTTNPIPAHPSIGDRLCVSHEPPPRSSLVSPLDPAAGRPRVRWTVQAPCISRDVRDDVFYHIMPITWRDSDNDVASGTPAGQQSRFGDFNGLTAGLPYLQQLGITAVWLNPIFPSPAYHGYHHGRADQVNSRFGTECSSSRSSTRPTAARAAASRSSLTSCATASTPAPPTPRTTTRWCNNPASPYDTWLAFTNTANSQYTGSSYTTWTGTTCRLHQLGPAHCRRTRQRDQLVEEVA